MTDLHKRLLDAGLSSEMFSFESEDGTEVAWSSRGNAEAADLAVDVFYNWLTDRAIQLYMWRKDAHDPRKAPDLDPGQPDPLAVFVTKLMEARQTIHPAELAEEFLFALAMELEPKGEDDA